MQMLPQELRPDGSPRSTSNTAPTQHQHNTLAFVTSLAGHLPLCLVKGQISINLGPAWPCHRISLTAVRCISFCISPVSSLFLLCCAVFFCFFFNFFNFSLPSFFLIFTYILTFFFFFFFFFATCSYPCLGRSEHCGIRPAHPAPVSASRPVVQT